MKSSAFIARLLAALVAGAALFTALPAQAHDRDRWRDRHFDRHEWRDDRGHRHWRGHHRDRWDRRDRVIIKERVVVRRAPVREYHYYDHPSRVYAPHYRRYHRAPAIVIGVDLPPIVIPLR